MQKRIAIFCGGKSVEHEISLISASNVLKAIDLSIFEPILIWVDKNGTWHLNAQPNKLLEEFSGKHEMSFHSAMNNYFKNSDIVTIGKHGNEVFLKNENNHLKIDFAFPLIHGFGGEDGKLQGIFEFLGLPYAGSGVLSSALCMNKYLSKKMLASEGINVVPFLKLDHEKQMSYQEISKELGPDLIIKPNENGSSVGINIAKNEKDFSAALKEAFKYSEQVLVEKFLATRREIECAMLGNEKLEASCLGEIQVFHEFYSYEAKYIDPNGAKLIIDPDIEKKEEIKSMAKKAFKILGCKGFARVDFLVSSGEIFLNEINTIPGFTNISMFPLLWQNSGIAYQDLITRIINLACC